MSYSDFNLNSVLKIFKLCYAETADLFANEPELESSPSLTENLRKYLPIAVGSNTEKSRSEMIIAPILLELRSQLQEQIGLFSGIDFTVSPELGLNGICDFLITRSPELLIVRSPVIAIVEAKKENISLGLGQCVAEMLAAQIFNQQEGKEIQVILGTVTTGTVWKFLKLEGTSVEIDTTEYLLSNVNKILGILASVIRN
jgi:co-chaperonin GroES (HSP10)